MRVSAVLLLVVCCAVFLAPVHGSAEILQKQFVIGSWVGPQLSEAQYRLYKDAGFNTVLDYPWEGDHYTKTLSLSEKVGGLSVILNVEQKFQRYRPERIALTERIDKYAQDVKGNKGISGYLIMDEPHENDAELTIEALKQFKLRDADRLSWINFDPTTNKSLALSIVSKSKPSVISTCYYPYTVKRNSKRLDDMYPALEFYRSLSLEYGVPLWLFVQSVSQVWPPDRNYDMRMPTAAELRMQVYANLAYGAKGLWYYTYNIPLGFRDISAAIVDNAKATPVYDSVKQLNREVQTLGPLLMTLTSVDVMHVKPAHRGLKPFVPNNTIAGVEGDDLLVGFFKDAKGSAYFMLVNKLTNGANKNIRLALAPGVKGLSQIDSSSGQQVKYPMTKGAAVVNLDPGSGMLFKVN